MKKNKNKKNNSLDFSSKTLDELSNQFSQRQNDIRALICFAVVGTLISSFGWDAINIFDWVFVAVVLLYTLASYIHVKQSAVRENYAKVVDLTMTADAAIIGAVLAYSGFNLLPTVLFTMMIQFNSLINGGVKKWAGDNLALGLGIVAIFAIREPQWVLAENVDISAISMIGIVAYFCAYALFAHNRISKLEQINKKIVHEQTQHKLRTYKLARYLTPTVWKAVNEGRENALISERKRITIFFSDIKGFSTLSEEMEAESLTDLLNTYLSEMANIANKHRGTIDKFMGDGVMILFGDNRSEGVKQDCLRCVSMAIEMRKKMKELQNKWYNQGIKKPLQIRMGVNTGYCTVGSFGTGHYMDYTALGTHVNLASRLESAADAGEILVSHETWSLIKDVVMCRDKGEIRAKGFSNEIRVYQLVDFRKDLGKHQSYFEENTQGFSMHLDLDKIRNYDKSKVVNMLQHAAEQLKDKVIK